MASVHLLDIMTPERAVAFLLFAAVAAGTPGPSNLLLTATGARAGVVRGLPAVLGAGLGMGAMMLAVAFGLGSAVLASRAAMRALNVAGAAFLLWLAWRIATAPAGGTAGDRGAVGFVGAAAFQWINPKSWLVSASAAGTFLSADGGSAIAQSAFLGGLFVAGALPSCFLWLVFGATVQRVLRDPRGLRLFDIAMGALLAPSIVLIV
jgi:threonine/homoserine/homoserine lactone efflux protein